MAISDLKSMIESLPNLDAAMQATVRQEIFKRLQDSSSDVQAIALNWYRSIHPSIHYVCAETLTPTTATACARSCRNSRPARSSRSSGTDALFRSGTRPW